MKNLKYEHKSIFPCGGGSNLILGIGRENQIFLVRTPAAVKFFSQNCQKMTFWYKKIITHEMHLYNPYRVPPHYSKGEL